MTGTPHPWELRQSAPRKRHSVKHQAFPFSSRPLVPYPASPSPEACPNQRGIGGSQAIIYEQCSSQTCWDKFHPVVLITPYFQIGHRTQIPSEAVKFLLLVFYCSLCWDCGISITTMTTSLWFSKTFQPLENVTLNLGAVSEVAPLWENAAGTHRVIICLELPLEEVEHDPLREALWLQRLHNVTSLLHKWWKIDELD